MSTEIPWQFIQWYENLPSTTKKRHDPARGVISAALAVLDHLKEKYDLDLNSHTTPSDGQVRTSGEMVKAVLARFGEHRHYTSEGGRTNRGSIKGVERMLKALKPLQLHKLPSEEREAILDSCQFFLVEKVRAYHNRQRIKITYSPEVSTWHLIQTILHLASEEGKAGPVAQHLVGAKLQLRFPDTKVRNEGFSTADQQTGRPGDFLIGDTAIHVTVAPMQALYAKCKRNINEGYKAYILVPDRRLQGARQNIEIENLSNKVTVESLESFISQNVEELSKFTPDNRKVKITALLNLYNERVNEVESDKSLMIDLPNNLKL